MTVKVIFVCLLLILLACFTASAGRKTPDNRAEAIVFIDSAHLAQKKMVREVNHQLYYSRVLQRRVNVTFIDINLKGELFHGPANYLKDDAGEWVEKYRPNDIPAMYCVRKGRMTYKKMASARELRSCL
ncbi:hypothetical protein [Pantoea sp. BAV 3049]|uniref:hypothetical protein n=1 Tax=Pantoea sp. BAV 3049 TaxID=2654188 RepID=UPI00131DCDA1|nr:hypothetical protein [Pantoea sp. BAV 3049]